MSGSVDRGAPSALGIEILTLFPAAVQCYLDVSVLGRALRAGVAHVTVHDLRLAARAPHRGVDDTPFGGGPGMVLAPEPVFAAVEQLAPVRPLYLMSPGGRRLDQALAAELASSGGFSLLCGRYEGVDERIAEHLCDGELSVGDYVLAGGELAALVVAEAAVRLLPGALGNEVSSAEESFSDGLLEHAQYTRPADFRGWEVPAVLRGGDHGAVARWRLADSLRRTVARRPDLIERRGGLRPDEVQLLVEHGYPVTVPEQSAAPAAAPVPAPRQERDPR